MGIQGLKRFGKKAVAVLMALCLSVLMVPAAAFAAIAEQGGALAPGGMGGDAAFAPANIEGKAYVVEVDASTVDASATHGDISTVQNGVGVLAKNGHTGTATVGNVHNEGFVDDEGNVQNASALGVYAHADGGNTDGANTSASVTAGAVTGFYAEKAVFATGADATVNATVDSVDATTRNSGNTFGVNSDIGKNGTSNVKVKGDVTISGSSNTTAVISKTTDPSAASTVTVGDVNMTTGAYALWAYAYSGGVAKLTASNVTATDVSSGYSYGNGPAVVRGWAKNGGTAELTMGNLEAKGNSYVGARLVADKGSKITFNAGNITMEREGSSYAFDGSINGDGARGDVKIGNITSNGGKGLNHSANGGATLNLVTGDITGTDSNGLEAGGGTVNATLGNITSSANSGLHGLSVSGKSDAGSKFTVTTGSITASAKALSFYTYAPADDPDKITVNGNLTSTGNSHDCGAIYASSAPGCIDLTVNGSAMSNYYTISGSLQGSATITGDVISTYDGGGIPAISSVAYKGPLDLFVGGTISSNGPALNNNAENYGRLTLTTWKVESGTGEQLFNGDTDGTFAKTVNYIVKSEQPAAHGTISVVRADGKEFAKSHDCDVARQGDRILVKPAELESNYYISKAYNGKGADKVELPKDENGDFYLDVADGGGIYLTAELTDKYPVTFENYDGTVLQTKDYLKGETPKYEGETPARTEDDQYVYVFTGWDSEIKPVTGAAIYKATYSVIVKPRSIAGATVTFEPAGYRYTGKVQKPVVKVVLGGATLAEGLDYTLKFSDENPEDVDTYTATVTGTDLFKDEASATFAIDHYDMSKFKDLDKDAWYLTTENGAFTGKKTFFLDYTLATGMMSGYTGDREGLFGPTDAMSRAMVATVIYRMATGATADEPYATVNTSGLSDVEPNQWYTAAVNWCVANKVITGYTSGPDAGRFCPDKNTSREELATITGRYCTKVAGMPSAGDDVSRFSDASKISGFAKEGVAFCVANKVVGGYTDGTNRFDPQGEALRCQGAKIFAVTARLLDAVK